MIKIVTFIICIFILTSTCHASVPSFAEARSKFARSDAILYDRHHEVIHELRIKSKGRSLGWIGLNEISPALTKAVVAAEDKRFYSHHGVDWLGLSHSVAGVLFSKNRRGASTLTMQLASFLNENLRPIKSRRSLSQKYSQIIEAWEIEKSWTKSEILEAYLNLVSYAGEIQGVDAASRWFFDKDPHGLNGTESILLTCLLRSPGAGKAATIRRMLWLADGMALRLENNAVRLVIDRAFSGSHFVRPQENLAPLVARRLLNSKEVQVQGWAVSTLDKALQRLALQKLQNQFLSVRSRNVHDGALLVVENKTGQVLAYVGNVGEQSSARFVDGVQAKRQAGSTLKPFLYGLAFEQKNLTPASLIEDSPLEVPLPFGVYRPENYDHDFKGLVTVRTALASSMNVPAVKALNLVGVDPFLAKLKSLGFEELNDDGDFYGLSLALGSADVSLWDLVNAYRALANGGVWSLLQMSFNEEPPRNERLYSKEVAFIVSDILSDRESRSDTFGLENPLATRFWTAVKTGTSKDMRDNWCVGYSDRFTVGVWVGNFDGNPMWNVSGITGAAPVWVEVMNWLHQNRPSRAPQPPGNLVAQKINALNAERTEWFIKGTEPQKLGTVQKVQDYRIKAPSSGTIMAYDPDIPLGQQKVLLDCQPYSKDIRWVLDGSFLGTAEQPILWDLKVGRHQISLVDESDKVQDSIAFNVQGAEMALSDSDFQ